ncbi:MAG: hypothetical protein WC414_00900 [Patescibacteria group bacterium]
MKTSVCSGCSNFDWCFEKTSEKIGEICSNFRMDDPSDYEKIAEKNKKISILLEGRRRKNILGVT